jgi:polar amino acid transport system substrate-binding protein
MAGFYKLRAYTSVILIVICAVIITGCQNNEAKDRQILLVGVAADYPPFEFIKNKSFYGLDIDLARLMAKKLNKKIQFKNYQYHQLFTALNNNEINLAISAISYTKERSQQFDLSDFYYFTDLAVVFSKSLLINQVADLYGKKVGVQSASIMADWARSLGQAQVITMDVSLQLIEALNSNQVDAIVLEHEQWSCPLKTIPLLFLIMPHKFSRRQHF